VLVLVLTIGLIVSTSAGCSSQEVSLPTPVGIPLPQPSSATPPAEIVTITFGIQDGQRSRYTALVAAFNERNPDLRVQLVSTDAIISRLLQGKIPARFTYTEEHARAMLSAADTLPDNWIGAQHLTNGYVNDLTPFIDADPTFQRDDFFPGVLDPQGAAGQLYRLPHTRSLPLLSYNRELWEERGLPPPRLDWSWQEMMTAAAQVAAPAMDPPIYGFADLYPRAAIQYELAASRVQIETDAPSPIQLNQPEIAAALVRVAAHIRSGALYTNAADTSPLEFAPSITQQVVNQQVGIWRSYVADQDRTSANPITFTTGIVLAPPLPGDQLTVSGYVMSAGTQHPDAAWRWLAFLSHHDASDPSWNRADAVPARRSLAEQRGYWEQFDAATAAALQRVVEQAPPPPSARPLRTATLDALTAALAAIVNQNIAPELALAEAQAALETTQSLAATAQPNPAPLVVATPARARTEATEIRFAAPSHMADPLRQAADQFNAQQTAMFVNIEPLESTADLATAATSSDCFFWSSAPTVDELTSLADSQPLLDAQSGNQAFVLTDEYPPAVLAGFQHNGRLLGLPATVKIPTLGYNREAFAELGIAEPDGTWTPNVFVERAQQLTTTQNPPSRYGYATPLPNLGIDFNLFLAWSQVEPVRYGDNVAVRFTAPDVVEAVRRYVSLLQQSSPYQQVWGYSQQHVPKTATFVTEGNAAMWFNVFPASLTPRAGFTPAAQPLKFNGGKVPSNVLPVSGFYISAETAQVGACWDWITALSSASTVFPVVNQPDRPLQLPARRSVAIAALGTEADPAERTSIEEAYLSLFASSAAQAPKSHYGNAVVDTFWFYRAVDRAVQGGDLERELQEAQTLTEAHLACVQGGGQPGPCARQVDPTYEGFSQ
jgi:multiple sugar transport system substrate-binding protein